MRGRDAATGKVGTRSLCPGCAATFIDASVTALVKVAVELIREDLENISS